MMMTVPTTTTMRTTMAHYINLLGPALMAGWQAPANDNRAVFTAAAHAQRAADFVHKFSVADTTEQQVSN
jgi:antirestriction protein ArdC